MARRSRKSRNEELVKAAGAFLLLISLAVGGIKGVLPVFLSLIGFLVAATALFGAIWLGWRIFKNRRISDAGLPSGVVSQNGPSAKSSTQYIHTWTIAEISEAFGRLDWYQFEKVNAAILQLEGWSVQRRGGASPDGGVDLIAERAGEKKLIQCKHWSTWKVQEKVVRELLGSMTHMNVGTAALHTMAGWTAPASALAAQHAIELSDRDELSQRARTAFSDEQLDYWFKNAPRCCPKCDGEMILRTGNFDPFWGCRRFPRCRGKINAASDQPTA